MRFKVDADVQAVLEFMQSGIKACKLVGVADSLAQIARILWSHIPQEPVQPCSLTYSDLVDVRPRGATESALDKANVDGGSVVEGVCP